MTLKTLENYVDEQRLKLAILSILACYNGCYEDSLHDWYQALKLVNPRLCAPEELARIFVTLSNSGIIHLRKTTRGDYSGREDDAAFFHAGAFTATLTAKGLVHWESIRAA